MEEKKKKTLKHNVKQKLKSLWLDLAVYETWHLCGAGMTIGASLSIQEAKQPPWQQHTQLCMPTPSCCFLPCSAFLVWAADVIIGGGDARL